VEITVLGRYSPWPPAGGACSGYLVRSGETSVLVDGGPGVAARLMSLGGIDRLTAIVVSHLHDDHVSDIHCLQFAVLAAKMAERRTQPLPVFCPSEPVLDRGRLYGPLEGLFEIHVLPEDGLQVGSLRFSFARTAHPILCYAMRVTDGKHAWFYSADTNRDATERLLPLATGADLAFVEATFLEASGHLRFVGHMTARDAATFGRQAKVKRMLLTHLWPETDPAEVLVEARAVWPDVELVQEMETYRLGA
jgi:ribonuclease BN (tRNA processing enzyme)